MMMNRHNPTLSHKLNNDFGIIIPEFDSAHDSPSEYIEKLFHKVENKGWNVEKSTHLTNLSFLKINMYKDLERNEEKLNSNIVIAALAGEQDPIQVTGELNNFDHDKQIRPIDTFQVVDADSSQQDAVLLSKKEQVLFCRVHREQVKVNYYKYHFRSDCRW